MKTYIKILFGLSVLFFSLSANATHLGGSEITYRSIDSCRYEITMIYYRWCSGVSLFMPSASLQCLDNNGVISATQSLSPTFIELTDITPVCDTEMSPCNPQNTRIPMSEGIEKHVYRDTVDLCADGSALLNCKKMRIVAGTCCRGSDITTGSADQMFLNFAEIDNEKALVNSSPIFSNNPNVYLCCNQPFYYNLGAIDTTDYDSLSYSWDSPRSTELASIPYITGGTYSASTPFGAFFVPAGNTTFVDPQNDPPIGIFLDPSNGDIIFTPTVCNEVTVAVVQVTEWRKDSSGVYQEIGKVRRDLQYTTKECPTNYAPTINVPTEYSVCEGAELCFDVNTQDQTFIPPPPLPVPAGDTVTLTWNQGIPQATFTIIDTNARMESKRFCWTPPEGSASLLPYTFTATARDNACPINALTTRAFAIRVIRNKNDLIGNKDTTELCYGDALTADIHADTYLWNTGHTAKTITPTTNGIYSVDLNTKNCIRTDSTYVELFSKPAAPVLTLFDGLIASDLVGTHQWFKDNVQIPAVVANRINITNEKGTYYALYIDSNGCVSDSSNTITATLGLDNIWANNLIVYPNPTNGKVTIDASGLGTIKSIKLLDTHGKLVEHTEQKNGPLIQLNWTIRSGLLYVVIETDIGVYRGQIVAMK